MDIHSLQVVEKELDEQILISPERPVKTLICCPLIDLVVVNVAFNHRP